MSERIFRLLLRLYPRRFREEYGEEMRQVFRDRLRAESGLQLWRDVLLDAAVAIPREHRRPPSEVVAGYRMSEAGVNALVRQGHLKQIPLAVTSILFAAWLAWKADAPPVMIGLSYGLMLWGATAPLRGLERLRQQWRGYELSFDGEQLLQLKDGVVTQTLQRSEVERLVEDGGFGLLVESGTADQRSIWIPAVVNGYEELRARLEDWGPVEASERHGNEFLGHLPAQWILLIYPVAVLSQSPWFGIGLTGLCAVGIIVFLRMFLRAPRGQASRVPMMVALALLVILAVRVWRFLH